MPRLSSDSSASEACATSGLRFFLSLALAGLASALPAFEPRQTSACADLGASAFDTASGFTLAAVNLTLPNANATGAPLLTTVSNAAVGSTSYVISVRFRESRSVVLRLARPGHLTRSMALRHSGCDVTVGGVPTFIFDGDDQPAPAPIYCGVTVDGDSLPSLAVHGEASVWYLCDSTHDSTVNLVYEPSDHTDQYLFDSCYSVRVHIVNSD